MGQDVQVNIEVKQDSNGNIVVEAPDITVSNPLNEQTTIYFNLAVDSSVTGPHNFDFPISTDYTLPDGTSAGCGISITEGDNEFPLSDHHYEKTRQVSVVDKNDNNATYQYMVTVLDYQNGNRAYQSDPSIRNGGSN